MSFLIWAACPRLQEHALVRFCKLISWEGLIEHGGSGAFWRRALKPHDPLAMLKALISQAWHCLSDAQLEAGVSHEIG